MRIPTETNTFTPNDETRIFNGIVHHRIGDSRWIPEGEWNTGVYFTEAEKDALIRDHFSEFLRPDECVRTLLRESDIRRGQILFHKHYADEATMCFALEHEIAHVAQLHDEDFENGVVTWEGLNLDKIAASVALRWLHGDWSHTPREMEVVQIQQALFPKREMEIAKRLPAHPMSRDEMIARFHKNWNRIKSLAPEANPGYVPWYTRPSVMQEAA